MKKILNILLAALMGISVLMLVLVFVLEEDTGVTLILNWAYVLVILAILSAIIFPIIHLAQNPKGAMRSLLGVAVVLVVVGVSFALASSEPVVLPDESVVTNVFDLKLADAGMYTAYVALIGAIVAAIYGEIRNSFK